VFGINEYKTDNGKGIQKEDYSSLGKKNTYKDIFCTSDNEIIML